MNIKLLLALVLLAASSHVAAKAYRGLDEDGSIYYTDAPPPQAAGPVQEIKMDTPPPPMPTEEDSSDPADSPEAGEVSEADTSTPEEKAEIAKKCTKTKQLYPEAIQAAKGLFDRKAKSDKISKDELKAIEHNIEQAEEPTLTKCKTDYKLSDSLRTFVDCFAKAETGIEAGLFCIAFAQTVDNKPEKP